MAKGKLTVAQINEAAPEEKPYTLADGGGLVLQVMPNGSKRWRFRYRFQGKAKMLSMGSLPPTTRAPDLELARKKLAEARNLLEQKIDPSAERKAEKQAHADTFKAVADDWLANREKLAEVDKKTLDTIRSRLDNHILPRIGNKPIAALTTKDCSAVVARLINAEMPEMAKRVRVIMSQVFEHGQETGMCHSNPARKLKKIKRKARSFAAVKEPEPLAELLRMIFGYEHSEVVAAALKLAPLTMLRPGELRHLEWADVDLENSLITIPGHRMKVKETPDGKPRDHLVPLSTQAADILRDLKDFTGSSKLVFPGFRTASRPISDMTLTAALRRMGIGPDVQQMHGFRHTASTLLNELGFNRDWIETALAHVDGSVRGTYNAALYLEGRRSMLQFWADYLDALREGKTPPKPGMVPEFANNCANELKPSQDQLAAILGV